MSCVRRLLGLIGSSILAVLSAPACSDPSDDDAADAESELSTGYVTAKVEAALQVRNPSERGKTWSITTGNVLEGGWLLQVPSIHTWGQPAISAPRGSGARDPDFGLSACVTNEDCSDGSTCQALEATRTSPGGAKKNLCVGHSDYVLDSIYGVMTRATRTLDVTTLTAPTGRFLATMRNALTTLSNKSQEIRVRVLIAEFPGAPADPAGLLAQLTRDVPPSSPLRVSVGVHRRTPVSWNHSKIIAVDGREAIVGGMNLWDDHYLGDNPVRDVSIHVKGPAAADAQIFVNQIWPVACRSGKVEGNKDDRCPAPFEPGMDLTGGNVRIVAVGRTGEGGVGRNRNPSDTALIAMMDAARSSIRISQQDLGSVRIAGTGAFPDDVLDAFTRAARRGVDVTVTLSNEGAFGGNGMTTADSYANGWSLEDAWNALVRRADEVWPGHRQHLCDHVHFQSLRSSPAATWPNGRPLANHAKVVIVDDQAHYVGSQNLYSADLAEFGFIVDDRTATQRFIADYWDRLDEHSRTTRFRGPHCR